jgi:hypothetical protein
VNAMKKLRSMIGLAIVGSIAMAPLVHARTLLKDNFDSDAAGSFPAGWNLLFDGGGTNLQIVDTAHVASPPNSLRLVGSSCWSANIFHPITFPRQKSGSDRHVTVSGRVFVGQIGGGGCTPFTARISLFDPGAGEWGTPYTGAVFESDGYIHANWPGQDVQLIPYKVNSWYRIMIEADMTAQTSNIYIDGKLRASNLPFAATGAPTGIELGAGHGNSPTAWFDNISVVSR